MKVSTRLSISTLFVIVIFSLSAVAYAAGPPNIVTNGDFSNGTTSWTPTSIIGVGSSPCGAEVAKLTVTSAGEDLSQCINIITQPSSDWTYSIPTFTDVSGGSATGLYEFFGTDDCTGTGIGNNFGSGFALPGSQSSISNPTGAESVRVIIRLAPSSPFNPNMSACIDNISFEGTGATVVTMNSINATTPNGSYFNLWIIGGLFFLLSISTVGAIQINHK